MLALPLVGFAIASYAVFADSLRDRTDAFIDDALMAITREVSAERRFAQSATGAIRTTLSEVRFRDLDIWAFEATGAVVGMSAPQGGSVEVAHPIAVDSAEIAAAMQRVGSQPFSLDVKHADGGYRIRARPFALAPMTYWVVGAYPVREIEATLGRIRTMFLLAIPLLILAAATGGWLLARRSLAPVAAMASRAAEISASTLYERLPADTTDELGDLARVLNSLLDRMEYAFDQQKRFMADASHELRTPAAILRAESDVTLSRDHRDEAEYRESFRVMRDASHRLSRVVEDLFLAARADAGQVTVAPVEVYLEEVIHDAVRAVRPLAVAPRVQVEFTDAVGASVLGDADLLGRILLNLLENALRHSPVGGTIEVSLRRHEDRYVVSVIDAGPGIPRADWEHIFERFVRLDPARSRVGSAAGVGAGLGLGIARRLAVLHGGQLVVADSRPGRTEFQLTLPVAPIITRG
ncbi:MAG: HAMP domain-containing protein [Gemmatimonadetes bacterium]|nr:HAMP domain-containing protein [Gemmatimonadota bacterium]